MSTIGRVASAARALVAGLLHHRFAGTVTVPEACEDG